MRVWRYDIYKKRLEFVVICLNFHTILLIFFVLQRGVFVAGLREEIVDNAEQVLKIIEFGEGEL